MSNISSFRDQIAKSLEKATGIKNPEVDFSSNEQFGDYTSNVAMVLSKEKKTNPLNLAKEIAVKFKSDLIEKVEVAGPGFINFYLKTDVLVDNLIQIDKLRESFGKSDFLNGKKLMFEFAHPNTHKAFHIGHLRNITTGESLARIHEFVGAEVVRANYQGDIGLHIAKALYGIQIFGFEDPIDIKKRAEYLGRVYAVGATAFEETDEAKEKVGEINKKIYDKSDSEINKLYEETRKWSLDYFEEIYKRVYTKFDRLYFESECALSGKEIALKALKDGILTESEGATIFEGTKYGTHDRVFISGKGVPTYEGKDLGLARKQLDEYNPDIIIHVLGPEQLGYTSVLFQALELIFPEIKGRELHLPYGWVRLKEGKMSSRTGNVILGEKILDDAKQNVLKNYKIDESIAEMIAVGAVKYSFLKTGINQDISFDLKESISLEGNSGPYLQYTVARAGSVIAKVPDFKPKFSEKTDITEVETIVLKKLSQFPEIVEIAAKSYSPNVIATYLYELAQKYNTFYNKQKIIGSKNENFRLFLTAGVSQVLKNGLNLLGIESPEKM